MARPAPGVFVGDYPSRFLTDGLVISTFPLLGSASPALMTLCWPYCPASWAFLEVGTALTPYYLALGSLELKPLLAEGVGVSSLAGVARDGCLTWPTLLLIILSRLSYMALGCDGRGVTRCFSGGLSNILFTAALASSLNRLPGAAFGCCPYAELTGLGFGTTFLSSSFLSKLLFNWFWP